MQEVIGIVKAKSKDLSLNTDIGTKKVPKEPLTEEKILASAEKYYLQTGEWPSTKDTTKGNVPDMPNETWSSIDAAIRNGGRGLEHLKGSSLSKLLEPLKEKYGLVVDKEILTEEKILASAEKYYLQTGEFPKKSDTYKGNVPDMPNETWSSIDAAIRNGGRGLEHLKGKHLTLKDIIEPLYVKYHYYLTEEKVSNLIEKYYLKTGDWPSRDTTDPVPDMPNITWSIIDSALHEGNRGLTKGSSLTALSKPLKIKHAYYLTEEKVSYLIEKYYLQTGEWPSTKDTTKGNVPDMPNETWNRIQSAGYNGHRGLAKGATLGAMIERLKIRYNYHLTEKRIIASAEKYYFQTGTWLSTKDTTKGNVPDMPHESWRRIRDACRNGYRGLEHLKGKGQTLSKLLEPLKEKYNLTLTDAPLPKEFKRKVVKAPKKLEDKQIGERIVRKDTITFIKGEAFEQLVGLVLLNKNLNDLVIPQFCLDVDDKAGFFGVRADFKVGNKIYEVKWGNATSNIIKTYNKHQKKLQAGQNYNLVIFEKNSELTLSHNMFEELLENSPLESMLKEVSNLLLENVINPNKEFLEKLRDYLYSLNIKANKLTGTERIDFISTELSKFLGSDDKPNFMKENRYALYTPLEAYFEYKGKLRRGLITPKALQQESPEAYELYFYFDGLTFKDEQSRDIAVMCELSDENLLARELVSDKESLLIEPVFKLPNGTEIKASQIKDLEDLKKYLTFSGNNFEFGLQYIAFHGVEA